MCVEAVTTSPRSGRAVYIASYCYNYSIIIVYIYRVYCSINILCIPINSLKCVIRFCIIKL